MGQISEPADRSMLNRSLDIAAFRPFTLSIAFVIGAVLLLTVAIFVADQVGRRIGEASSVRLGTELAESDARIIGNSFASVLAARSLGASGEGAGTSPSLDTGPIDPLDILLYLINDDEVESLFSAVDYHHMGIRTVAGGHIWEIGSEQGLTPRDGALQQAASGETVSWLNRNVEIMDEAGQMASVDLLETLVPLGEDGSLVFHFVLDISDTLATNIAATRTEIRNATLLLLGVLLVLLAILVIGLDLSISRRNRAVVAVERTTRQQLDLRNAELERQDEAKNQFLSSLSHELKTPLAAILGFVGILKRNASENLSTRQLDQLEIVNRNGVRLDAMINDLLDLSRIQAGRIKLAPEETEATALLHGVVDGFETITGAVKQTVSVRVEHGPIWIEVDQTRIAQVISNLVSNASKYSPQGSSITVTSQVDGGTWVVTVEDEGSGISEEDQENLFTLFYRTKDAQESSVPGTGIGLYVSRQIANLHGGEISLSSVVGQGTSVRVTIPGARSHSGGSARLERHDSPRFANSFEELDEAS